MCNDLMANGMRYQTKPFTATLTSTASRVLLANPRRVALIISSDGTNGFGVGNVNTIATAGSVVVNATNAPQQFRRRDLADFVTGEIWGVSTSGATMQGYEVIEHG